MNRGLIHLYHGNGKGKTTAAMGLCLRAAGAGKKVVIVQFLKDGTSSELSVLRKLPNVTVLAGKEGGFTFTMTQDEKSATRELSRRMFDNARALAPAADVLLLDEACAAVNYGYLDGEALKDFLEHKPEDLEVILTGRNPASFLLEQADYVTEMVKHKHPYDQGIPARYGIEF